MEHASSTTNRPRVAIVGAGPSGCYTAQFLLKRWPGADIAIFDRADTPYGLIRYGVAPDHLGTKAIAKQFARLFDGGKVTFAGGVEIGRDVPLADLRADHDAVVLATGLWADRTLDGFHDASGRPAYLGVHGSGALTRMINGHPDSRTDDVRLGRRIVIVGTGNVAVDLVRLVLTPGGTLRELGVPERAIAALQDGPVERIDVVGRSSAADAKFDAAMIKELGVLPDVRFELAPSGLESGTASSPAAEAVGELVAASPAVAARLVRFNFGWVPERLTGDERVRSAVFRAAGDPDRQLELGADSVCTAVGFTAAAEDAVLRSTLESDASDLGRGVLAPGLYCVGWLRRGPVGTIPANRADARLVADAVIADLEAAGRHLDPTQPVTALKEHA
jgi:ferredoxin--NADP+ reductase